MHNALEPLLRDPPHPEPIESLDAWWSRYQALDLSIPIDRALVAGFAMDRLGYAFASGYQAAGAALFGDQGAPGALCATEAGGVHPRAIETKLERTPEGLRMSGKKSFVTLGPFAVRLWVVASEGRTDSGLNRLRVVRIDRREGVRLEALPVAPFIPEIPHAVLHLENVHVREEEVLPGDGYTAYLKPFRTVEDCYVHAALLGWLIQIARASDAPRSFVQDLLAAAVTIRGLALADPSSPAIHIALAGAIDHTRTLVDRMSAEWMPESWPRDRALLDVAGRARAARLEAAWRDGGRARDVSSA